MCRLNMVLLIAFLCTAILFGTGCAAQKASLEEECALLVEDFISAMQAGDYEKASGYATTGFQSAEDIYSLLDRELWLAHYLKNAKVVGTVEPVAHRQLFPEEKWVVVEMGSYTVHFRIEVTAGSLAVFPIPVLPESTLQPVVGESVIRSFNPDSIKLIGLDTYADPDSCVITYKLTLVNESDQTVGDMSTAIVVEVEPRGEFASLLRKYDAEMTRTEYQRTVLEAGKEAEYLQRYKIQGTTIDSEAFSNIAEQADDVTIILMWDLTREEIARFDP